MKAVIYEPWAKGENHYEFVKNFIMVIGTRYDSCVFFGDKNQIAKLRQENFQIPMEFISIKQVDCSKLKDKIRCLQIEMKNIKRMLSFASNEDIFITYGMPYTYYCLKKMKYKGRVFFVMHGLLEQLKDRLKVTDLAYWLRKILVAMRPPFYIVVLGNSIKYNLERFLPNLHTSILVLNHPYSCTVLEENLKAEKEFISIGTVGVGSFEKGTHKLGTIAEYCHLHDIPVKCTHIGMNSDFLRAALLKKGVDIPFQTNNLIPYVEFSHELKKMDYLLYLYDENSYKLTASGALFDAFRYRKPILSLRNDFFAEVFGLYPNIGYLFDSIETLCMALEKLPSIDSDEYRMMVNEGQKALKFYQYNVCAKLFFDQIVSLDSK